jgi:hypothetical protein
MGIRESLGLKKKQKKQPIPEALKPESRNRNRNRTYERKNWSTIWFTPRITEGYFAEWWNGGGLRNTFQVNKAVTEKCYSDGTLRYSRKRRMKITR